MPLLDQVRATIVQHNLFARGDTIVIGVSGGPDSLVLLHVLRALREELQIALHIAHLNHQLRGKDSDADAGYVSALAREWGLPATVEVRDVGALARQDHVSLEQAARQARYAFLARIAQHIGARVVAVAHNADDQVETVLMHFIRGAGLAGLRGMQYKSEIGDWRLQIRDSQSPSSNLQLVRPLLDVTRVEIEKYCQAHYLAPRNDQSNFDTTILRNRLRHQVLPFLEELNPNLRAVLLRTACSTADDYDFLHSRIRAAYDHVAQETAGVIIFDREVWRALHPALQRGTLRVAIQQLRQNLRDVEWTHVENARRIALEKTTGAEATLPQDLVLVVGYSEFVIRDAARRLPLPDMPLLRVERLTLPFEGITELPHTNWVVETGIIREQEVADQWTAFFDPAKCRGEIYLRCRQPGDRFQPAGLRGHSQSLNAFLINEKIPSAVRDQLPILIIGEHIAWVCGWRTDERARARGDLSEVWRVAFRKKSRQVSR